MGESEPEPNRPVASPSTPPTTTPNEMPEVSKQGEVVVPLPEVEPELIELALSHYYYLKLFSSPKNVDGQEVPYEKRSTVIKTYERQKIKHSDWRKLIKQMAMNPDKAERDKTPYWPLAHYFLGMSQVEYVNIAQPDQLQQIIDALIVRTKAGLPYLSVNLRNLFFKGKADLDGDEEEIYQMYKLQKKFSIRPWDLQDGEVYTEDINGLLRMDEWDKSRMQFLRQQEAAEMEDLKQKVANKWEEYLKGKTGAVDPLPPLPEDKDKDKGKQESQDNNNEREGHRQGQG